MHKSRILILIAINLSLIGCASGPAFKPVDPIPEGKGVVYIYREHAFMGAGSAVTSDVSVNNAPITNILNGGYYPYISDPGTKHFEVSTETTNEANVVVEAGKEKYLKTTLGMGFVVGHLNLTEVSPEIGKKEIAECNLLDPIKLINE
jgi:hypothetical protein